MPEFTCQMCQESFQVPSASLEKFPGWEPRYCRKHSPKKKSTTARTPRKKRSSSREENLTLAKVLEKYSDGPTSGIFTDGSSHPNPGPGGWGFVWVNDGEIQLEGHGAENNSTTNNRMEFTALIEAYRSLPADAEVNVFSDSQLCVKTITEWAPGWERNDWKRKKGDPLKNLDLVKELLRLYRAHPACPLQWMKAHAGFRWNEYADSLASAWRRSEL